MLAPGNLRQVYEAVRDRWRVGDAAGYGEVNPLMAQMVLGMRPSWYVLAIVPAHERQAATHLADRRFGVFLPEASALRVKRGKRITSLKPMFPGYLFVWVWLDPANHHRVVSVPGVMDFLRHASGWPAVIPDELIRLVQTVENEQQPLSLTHEHIGVFRKIKKRWRRERRIEQQPVFVNEIVSVHIWSALRDGLANGDHSARNRLLHQALGLAA